MLRIKKDVDLKELEKFGFEYETDEDESYWCKYLSDNEHKLFIFEKDREIDNFDQWSFCDIGSG